MASTSQSPPTPRRKMATWKIVLLIISGSVATLVILGAIGFYLLLKAVEATPDAPGNTVIDLAKDTPIPPDAYTVQLVGDAQLAKMIVIERTFAGSSTKTAYIPYTGPAWSAGQPVRVLRKEQISSPPSSPLFETIEHPQIPSDTLKIRRDAIPGIVRAGLDREHVTLAPDAILVVGRFDD